MKEFDTVELITDREKYAKRGVHKGMIGTIMDPRKINGHWYVIFENWYTGEDIADISIKEEDLIVLKYIPKHKIPPPPEGWTGIDDYLNKIEEEYESS